MKKTFIQTNNKQLLGATLAKYAIQKNATQPIVVEIINVDEIDTFKKFSGKSFLRNGKERVYDSTDLQSFTISRFMPPELMGFSGKAIVIDPDIFICEDIHQLFNTDMQGHAIMACKKGNTWDTSVMMLDCKQLRHWRVEDIISRLSSKDLDYADLFKLNYENSKGMILEMSRAWNSLDKLNGDTKALHTTNRLTQPWKTGLPIDFTRNKMPRFLGIIPRELIHKILGKYNTHYLPHPDKKIIEFFFALLREALKEKVITEDFLHREIKLGHVRKDMFKELKNFK